MAEQNRYISKHHSQESRVVSQSGIAYNLGFILGASLCGVIVARTSSFGLGFGFLSLGWILSLVVWGKKRG